MCHSTLTGLLGGFGIDGLPSSTSKNFQSFWDQEKGHRKFQSYLSEVKTVWQCCRGAREQSHSGVWSHPSVSRARPDVLYIPHHTTRRHHQVARDIISQIRWWGYLVTWSNRMKKLAPSSIRRIEHKWQLVVPPRFLFQFNRKNAVEYQAQIGEVTLNYLRTIQHPIWVFAYTWRAHACSVKLYSYQTYPVVQTNIELCRDLYCFSDRKYNTDSNRFESRVARYDKHPFHLLRAP